MIIATATFFTVVVVPLVVGAICFGGGLALGKHLWKK